MATYAFGVDVGGTSVKIGLFEIAKDKKVDLLEKWEILTVKTDGGSHILPDIANSVMEKIAEKKIPKYEVMAIGIAVPGAVRSDGIVNRCVNLGWGGLKNVEEEMENLTGGIRTEAGNDATVAALGEMLHGAADGYQSMIMVTLGTGVGGGIAIDGAPLYGNNGAGGEIGHITVNPKETEVCGCGRRGCLEQYASASRFEKWFNRKMEAKRGKNPDFDKKSYLFLRTDWDEKELEDLYNAPSVLDEKEDIETRDIFDAAKAGDAFALAHVKEGMEILGYGCAIMSTIVDPEAFVIGGGVSRAGSIVTDYVKEYYQKYAFHATGDAEFTIAKLANDAGIWGAVKLVMDTQ